MIAPATALSCEAALKIESENMGITMEQLRADRRCRRPTQVRIRHSLVRRLFDLGYAIVEISEAMRWDHSSVHYVLNKSTVPEPIFGRSYPTLKPLGRIRSKAVMQARAALAVALRNEGLSWPEVADAAGYASHSGARDAAERWGCGNMSVATHGLSVEG